ncbi:DUF6088 family protein [Sphingobacterium paludis]|uniref:AbiEi antitoxin of type IV toxin-antitoxin system n=1 Tax=Sphingobacterium paludis TaxID=1476465 RepID=A0A4R7CYX8_9SPHI|nr:DUF6088 family protein [Sphingobacterium paludis]TDS11726.1 hypothetical protein B0I21_10767 [Sphingobacterium paludis]
MKTSKSQIEIRIIKARSGELFFADDFVKYASSDNVRKILSRLEQDGLIERLAHGIYFKSKKDSLLGTIYPNIGKIDILQTKRVALLQPLRYPSSQYLNKDTAGNFDPLRIDPFGFVAAQESNYATNIIWQPHPS